VFNDSEKEWKQRGIDVRNVLTEIPFSVSFAPRRKSQYTDTKESTRLLTVTCYYARRDTTLMAVCRILSARLKRG
jgi:hypothetical protein